MEGKLHLESWAGRSRYCVEILAETSTRYRVRLLERCLRGSVGDVLYVPKYAVTIEPEPVSGGTEC